MTRSGPRHIYIAADGSPLPLCPYGPPAVRRSSSPRRGRQAAREAAREFIAGLAVVRAVSGRGGGWLQAAQEVARLERGVGSGLGYRFVHYSTNLEVP